MEKIIFIPVESGLSPMAEIRMALNITPERCAELMQLMMAEMNGDGKPKRGLTEIMSSLINKCESQRERIYISFAMGNFVEYALNKFGHGAARTF